MNNGQSDIDAAPEGTTFCLSGTHNWQLSPKSSDRFIGPAVLDGANSSSYAVSSGWATNVVLSNLEIRNYKAGPQQGAIYIANGIGGWVLQNLQVHDNGTSAGGSGANLGTGWQVLGGRYYNNRQTGISGAGDGTVLDGVEIDHNNFTSDAYSTRNISCAFESGGFKLVAKNVVVKNSKIHDNACKGLWTDGGTKNATITNNQIYGNTDSGVFIETSSGATITGNNVYGNGHGDNGSGCQWLWGGGITVAASDGVTIANNTVSGNCNGITGTQQNRPDANPGLLENLSIHDNAISGPGGRTGVVEDNGANLTTRNIVFQNNTFSNGMGFCSFSC